MKRGTSPFRQLHHGAKAIGCEPTRIQLLTLLYGCTDEALARLTVEHLARTHRLSGHETASLREIEELLAKARASRVRRVVG
jgi:hypothetical protein